MLRCYGFSAPLRKVIGRRLQHGGGSKIWESAKEAVADIADNSKVYALRGSV